MSEAIEKIERAWLNRAEVQDLKPGTVTYAKRELEFFAGAMAAINALQPNTDPSKLSPGVPALWVVNAISGRPIVERPKDKGGRLGPTSG